MKVKFIFALVVFCAVLALPAEINCQEQMMSILSSFSSTNYWERMSVTNQIATLIAATTNGDELAECRLLKAAVLLECAETEHDDSARVEATNLLWALDREYANRHDDWRFFGVRLVMMQSLALSEDYASVYSLATNTIPSAPISDFERSTNVWTALFGPDIPVTVSLKDAYRFNAADAMLSLDRNANIFALTNGLPSEMIGNLIEIRRGN